MKHPVSTHSTAGPAWQVHLALLIGSLIYGAFYAVIKHVLGQVDEWTFIYLRLTGAAIVLALWEWSTQRTPIAWRQDGLTLFFLALTGVTLVQYLFVFGVHYTSTLHASVIMSCIPIITLCLAWMFKTERVSVLKVLGVGVAFVGVVWLITLRTPATAHTATQYPWWGNVLVASNALSFSLFLQKMPDMLKRYKPLTIIAYCYIMAAIIFDGLGLLGCYPVQWWPKLNANGWWLMVYTILGASIATYGLNNFALARSKPSTVAVYAFTQPVLAAVIGAVWLQEQMSQPMLWASGLSLVGLVLATVGRLTDTPLPNPQPANPVTPVTANLQS
jgi:drug/metabolite transporter (DMT)-like permease